MLYIYKKNKQNMGFKSNFLVSTSFIVFLFALMFPINELLASSTLKGMQLGDSNAPVKIIEYRSLTCSHCADFSNDTFAEIKENYIDKGKVNFELRPFALNAIDLNAFKLLHCVDENDFFAMDKILFKDQKKWIVTNQSDKVLENSTNALKNYGALFGVSEEAFNNCMENENITDFILEQRIEGVEEYDISSTPTFIINGEIYAGNMSINEFDEIIEKEIN